MLKDDFKLLGLPDDATKREVRERYYELARTQHPDAGGDVDRFTELNQAYQRCLTAAPEKRKCMVCGGSGELVKQRGLAVTKTQCKRCLGTGRS